MRSGLEVTGVRHISSDSLWNLLHVLSKAENIFRQLNNEDLKMRKDILIWNVTYSGAYLERTSDIKLEKKVLWSVGTEKQTQGTSLH